MGKRVPPKPSPRLVATVAFYRACGIASAPWGDVAAGIAEALKEASYLRDKTLRGAQRAEETIRQALLGGDMVPPGGDIDGSRAPEVQELALQALADTGQLTDRALLRINN
jgi:hypothetical protein